MARKTKPTAEGIVAELLTLLETITADGIIADDEIVALHQWLVDNRDSGVPSFDFLRSLIEKFREDGLITPAERKAIHAAVEKVLPPELREASKLARASIQLAAKAKAENEKARERAKRPIRRLDFMVAGVGHQERASTIDRFLRVGNPVYLVREPDNQYDANSVLVRLKLGCDVGHVPREEAAQIAPLLDAGMKQIAYCKKILDGRHHRIPVIQAQIFVTSAEVPNALAPSELPVALPPELPPASGLRGLFARLIGK